MQRNAMRTARQRHLGMPGAANSHAYEHGLIIPSRCEMVSCNTLPPALFHMYALINNVHLSPLFCKVRTSAASAAAFPG